MIEKEKPENVISQTAKNDVLAETEDDYMFYLKSKMDHFSAVPEKEKNY